MDEQSKTLEKTFEELEVVLEKLEEKDTTLEDSFHLYEEGMKLLQYCNGKIDYVEEQLVILNQNMEG